MVKYLKMAVQTNQGMVFFLFSIQTVCSHCYKSQQMLSIKEYHQSKKFPPHQLPPHLSCDLQLCVIHGYVNSRLST